MIMEGECAYMGCSQRQLAPPASCDTNELLDKHYLRKHGAGQGRVPHAEGLHLLAAPAEE